MDIRSYFTKNRTLLIVVALLIIVIGVYMRMGLLKYQGFFEPDGFFHYAVIKAAIANGYAIPMRLGLSGFPVHNMITEPLGFYYMSMISYVLFGKLISLINIMRLIPILFGILDMIGAYFLVRYLSKSKVLGLLTMFFVAVSGGDIARTGALVYRGDGFITIFMIIALIFFIKAFKSDNRKTLLKLIAVSTVVLGIGTAVWGGAPFMLFVYMVAVLLITIYGFIRADADMLFKSIIISLMLLVTYIIQHIWIYIKVIRGGEALSSLHFFIFYLPILVGSIIAYLLIKDREKFPSFTVNSIKRIRFIVLLMISGIILIIAVSGSYLNKIASGGGLVIAGTHLTESIQELQHPTLQFIWSSFNFQLPLAIIGVVLFILFANKVGNREMFRLRRINLNINAAFLSILSYFILTGYLQYNAVRFNSLLAVPVSILAAYSVYVVGHALLEKTKDMHIKKIAIVVITASLYMITTTILIFTGKLSLFGIYIDGVVCIILVGIISYIISKNISKELKGYSVLGFFFIGLVSILLFYGALLSFTQTLSVVQADGINSNFLSAVTWLKTNTLRNATTLAVWPDGSVIEGWGDRMSSTDSVGGQNQQRIQGFANFILNNSSDIQYLKRMGKPGYLLARYYWMQELGGIVLESGITNNGLKNQYGYSTFRNVKIGKGSTANSVVYRFEGVSFNAEMIINKTKKGTVVNSFSVNGKQIYALSHTILYDVNTGTEEEFNSTYNDSYNLTLMVFYRENIATKKNNISNAYILGNKLSESNLIRFLFLCNTASCNYGSGSSARMKLVYSNPDTKIFRISYK